MGDYYSNKKESFKVIACPKNISQAKVAGELIKDFSKDDLEDSKTAHVLVDEMILYPVLHNLPVKSKTVECYYGSPFKNTTLFLLLMFFLTCK